MLILPYQAWAVLGMALWLSSCMWRLGSGASAKSQNSEEIVRAMRTVVIRKRKVSSKAEKILAAT